MEDKRSQILVAGVLVATTLAVGALARGSAAKKITSSHLVSARSGSISLQGSLDRSAVHLGGDGTAHMELVIAADPHTISSRRRPTDLVLILDRSGSMAGDKIHHARASMRELIGQLDQNDRFALVSYASDARIDIPLTSPAHFSPEALQQRIEGIGTGGGTNMSSGIDLGFANIDRSQTQRLPHVILISDGLANEGDPTPDGLSRRARRAALGEYSFSTIGVGTDFNEHLMSRLADAGTGNYYYVRHAENLDEVFASELGAARTTVATGLALRVEPADGVRLLDAAGYPLEADGSGFIIRPGSLFAGQQRRLWLTLALPNDAVGEHALGDVSLSYTRGSKRHALRLDNLPKVACVADEDVFHSQIDVDKFGRATLTESFNKMKEEVAKAVKAGKRDRALHRLDQYRQTGLQLRSLGYVAAEESLDDVDGIESEVRSAFEGKDQAQKQNELSKRHSESGRDGRRVGAKRGAK